MCIHGHWNTHTDTYYVLTQGSKTGLNFYTKKKTNKQKTEWTGDRMRVAIEHGTEMQNKQIHILPVGARNKQKQKLC